jgi:hypothetical protein
MRNKLDEQIIHDAALKFLSRYGNQKSTLEDIASELNIPTPRCILRLEQARPLRANGVVCDEAWHPAWAGGRRKEHRAGEDGGAVRKRAGTIWRSMLDFARF